MNTRHVLKSLAFLLGGTLSSVLAQPVPNAYHDEPYRMHSGVHANLTDEATLVFREVVKVAGTPLTCPQSMYQWL